MNMLAHVKSTNESGSSESSDDDFGLSLLITALLLINNLCLTFLYVL